MAYESYLYQLLLENGWEAADWYHRQLFELIDLGQHDLQTNSPKNMDLLRQMDRVYALLPESALASRKVGQSTDRFRNKNSHSSSSQGGPGSKSGGSASGSKPFSGVPCKLHGPNARHTAAECRGKAASGGGTSASREE
jgi:hypothetical protein